MNNWRLLLLALAAVFQPIATFTEPNLIDGRQQCCELHSPLRDTRSSFHGTHRLEKPATSALRSLNNRDEIHHDRRNELRQRDSVYSVPLTRVLLDIPASDSAATANAFEYRLESANRENRDRPVDVHERDRTEIVRRLKPDHLTHRAVDRTFRIHFTHQRRDDRSFETLRDQKFKNDYRIELYGSYERQSKNVLDSQREIPAQLIRSEELRLTLNRDARHILRPSTDLESRIGAFKDMKNRPRIMRQRLSEIRDKFLVRPDSRSKIDNSHERRQLERNNEQRRSLSENTQLVHQSRNMRIRVNFRKENREIRQRLSVERFDVRHEQRDDRRNSRHKRENTGRNLFGDRRISPESQMNSKMNDQGDRNVYSRQKKGHREMMDRETRDETRRNPGLRLSNERIQMDRRHYRESKIMTTINRDVDSRREVRKNERIFRDMKVERENYNNIQEKLQAERTNFRDFRIMNNVLWRNHRDIDSTKAIRSTNRVSRETQYAVGENSHQRYSRDMTLMLQRNIRESRIMNTPNDREVDGHRQIGNEKKSTEIRREIRETPDHKIHSERIRMNRRQNRELRIIINAFNERGPEFRREIRYERLYREIREEIRENFDLRGVRERRQVDRRDIRTSRIINGMKNAGESESKQEIRYNGRLSRQARDELTREKQAESRDSRKLTVTEERYKSVSDRRSRSADSRNFRQFRIEPKLGRSAERRSDEAFRKHRGKIINRERETIEDRPQNIEMARNRVSLKRVLVGKVNPENDSIVNWHYVLYTLQAAYICTLFIQILTPSRSEKPQKINLRWLHVSSHYNPIKVD